MQPGPQGFCALEGGGHLVYEPLWKNRTLLHGIMRSWIWSIQTQISWKEHLEGQKYNRNNALKHITNPYPLLLLSLKLQFFSFVSFLSPPAQKKKAHFQDLPIFQCVKEKIYTYIGDMHVDHFTSKNTMNFNSEIDFEYRLSLLLPPPEYITCHPFSQQDFLNTN